MNGKNTRTPRTSEDVTTPNATPAGVRGSPWAGAVTIVGLGVSTRRQRQATGGPWAAVSQRPRGRQRASSADDPRRGWRWRNTPHRGQARRPGALASPSPVATAFGRPSAPGRAAASPGRRGARATREQTAAGPCAAVEPKREEAPGRSASALASRASRQEHAARPSGRSTATPMPRGRARRPWRPSAEARASRERRLRSGASLRRRAREEEHVLEHGDAGQRDARRRQNGSRARRRRPRERARLRQEERRP